MSTASAFAARRGEQVRGNQEMVGIGAANVAAGFFQGFPVSTSGSRTAVAEQAGSRSQVTGVVGAGVITLVLVFATGAMEFVPQPTLGAIVIVAALGAAVYYRVMPLGAEAGVSFLLAIIIGLEAATLRRRKLLWWRWRDAGVVIADDLVGAEQRFFDRWVARAPREMITDITPTVVAPADVAPPAHAAPESAPPPPAPDSPPRPYDPDSYVVGQFLPPGGTR